MRSYLSNLEVVEYGRLSCVRLAVGAGALLALSGCALGPGASTMVGHAAATLHGTAHGGQQPVSQAAIQLWAAGNGGNGSAATPLLVTPVFSDASGNFSVTGDYVCPSADAQMYVTATGGNPGLPGNATNAALALVTVLGDCGSLSAATNVTLNEVTTMAAAYALAPFANDVGNVGSSATNAAGLRTAMNNAKMLADTGSGFAPAANLPGNVTVETAKIYTLANLLASCVNSDGTTICQSLFADATAPGTGAPTDTFGAALAIAEHPAYNVATLFNDVPPQVPFGGGLVAAPNDWSMSMSITDSGLSGPTAVVVDGAGDVLVANVAGPVSAYTAQGVNLWQSANVIAGSNVAPMMAITADQEIWVTSGQAGAGFAEISSFGLPLSGGDAMNQAGTVPTALAADGSGGAGRLWTVDQGSSTASLLTASGTTVSGVAGVNPSNTLTSPMAIAADGQGNAWIANGGTVTEMSEAGAVITPNPYMFGGGRLDSIALDAAGYVWAADRLDGGLGEFDTTGQPVAGYLANGVPFSPRSIAIDGANRVWITNQGNNSLWQTQDGVQTQTTLGGDAGMHQPWGVAVDASGTVWVTSAVDSRLVAFIGLGTPVKTPALGLPQLP